jgi:chromosome partitioning protein
MTDTETESELLKCSIYVGKGGVGKTTSTAHLGVSAAQDYGLDVLLIDLAGTQNDLAASFGLIDDIEDPDAPISAVFGSDWEFIRNNIPDVVDRMIFETDEGVDLIPSDEGLSGADNTLASKPLEERYMILDAFLDEEIAPRYDLVLIDLPGNENNIVLNGLFATEQTVVPLKPGEFEQNQLDHLEADLERIIEDTEDTDLNVSPAVSMVIPTMVDSRTNQAKAFVEYLTTEYPDRASVPIPASQNVSDFQGDGQTLFAAVDDELYSTGKRAREAYREATTQLLDTLRQ